MSRAPESVEDKRTASAWAAGPRARASSALHRFPEWAHRGVLELAPGPQSDRVRHRFLQAYAVRVRADTAAIGARLDLLDAEGRSNQRACYLLALCRPDLSDLIFDEGATFAEATAWPAERLAVLRDKGTVARLHVLEACGDVPAGAEWTKPEDAEGGELSASARFLDLERAELVLLVQGRRYEVGAAWLERAR